MKYVTLIFKSLLYISLLYNTSTFANDFLLDSGKLLPPQIVEFAQEAELNGLIDKNVSICGFYQYCTSFILSYSQNFPNRLTLDISDYNSIAFTAKVADSETRKFIVTPPEDESIAEGTMLIVYHTGNAPSAKDLNILTTINFLGLTGTPPSVTDCKELFVKNGVSITASCDLQISDPFAFNGIEVHTIHEGNFLNEGVAQKTYLNLVDNNIFFSITSEKPEVGDLITFGYPPVSE